MLLVAAYSVLSVFHAREAERVTVTLEPYQRTAERAMAAAKRFLLADAPGVGKTYPAIAAGARFPGRRVVFCPAHLMHQWALSLNDMGEKSILFSGSPARKLKALEQLCDGQWLVASYHALGARMTDGNDRRRWRYPALQGPWAVAVMDEAHALRSHKAAWTKAALRTRAERLYALTGTPEIAHSGNWFALAALLGRLPNRSYWKFVEAHCHSTLGHFGRKIGGLRDPKRFHSTVLDPECYLRRTAAQVGLDVGSPITHRIRLVLSPAAQRAHDTAKLDYRKACGEPMFDAGTVAHYLRSLVSFPPSGPNPKLQAAKHALERHPGERAVLLTHYRDSRDRLARALMGDSRAVVTVRAEDTKAQQARAFDAFRSTPRAVLVGTLPHLKEGVDGLQCASVMVLYEQSWLHAENEQAVARLARRGQDSQVHVYVPVVDNTLDAAVDRAVQQRRRSTLRDLMEEA